MDATDAALGVPVLVAEIVFDATAAGCLDEVAGRSRPSSSKRV